MRNLTSPNTFYEKNGIYILLLKELTSELKDKIDKYIIKICEGERKVPLNIVKKKIIKRINKNESHRAGMISEFLIHILLNSENFKPCFLFFNLEGASFKKGFDGVYLKGENKDNVQNLWYLESKSAHSISTHKEKLNISYSSLSSMVSGTNQNTNTGCIISPWDNAYNHFQRANSKIFNTLESYLTELSNNFELEIYTDVKDYQIILASTIFSKEELKTDERFIANIENEIMNIKNKPSIDTILVAINCKLLDEVIQYVGEGAV